MIKHSLLLLLSLILSNFSILNAQNSEIDSLQNLLSNHQKEDTVKVNLLIELSNFYGNYDENILPISKEALALANKLNFDNGKINSFLEQARYYYYKSNYQKAVKLTEKALKIAQKINDKELIATCFSRIGVTYDLQGNYIKSLSSYQQSLKINEETGNKSGISIDLLNIGIIYFEQGYPDKALKKYEKALKIDTELGDKIGMVISLNNIIAIYLDKKKYDKALGYTQNSLKIANEIKDKQSIAYSNEFLGDIYIAKKQYDKAIHYTKQALVLYQDLGDKYGVCGISQSFADIYIAKKEYKKALTYAKKALKIANELNLLEYKAGTHELLSQIYEATHNYKAAHQHYKKFKALNDSTFNESNIKEITNLENQYKYDKEKHSLALEQEKKDSIQKTEIKHQKNIRNMLIAGIFLTILLVFVTAYGFFEKRKANKILAEQKEEILSTNEELNMILETVSQQKETIEISHRHTQESIHYASTIQEALLPSQSIFSSFLAEHFILYKPKDIVSGDFYYIKQVNNFLIIAVADCTGHGVPGALVSMLGISFLNEILIKKEFSTASDILEILRKQVKNSLKQTEKGSNQSKDGMDIALCVLDTQTNLMQFAGAYNPLYVVRDKELIEIKGTKNPIGIYIKEKNFENHEIQLQKEDTIYLFSDGYVDQFGGENDRKFMSKRFKKMLIDISAEALKEQKEIIEDTLQNWKNGREQVDDIAILGFKI